MLACYDSLRLTDVKFTIRFCAKCCHGKCAAFPRSLSQQAAHATTETAEGQTNCVFNCGIQQYLTTKKYLKKESSALLYREKAVLS